VNGTDLIAAERARQIAKEGYDAAHDDTHTHGELAIAGAILAVDGTDAKVEDPDGFDTEGDPWGHLAKHSYRVAGSSRVRTLTIAGALIAAEIDRLLRTEGHAQRDV
jgi:hypothetical protein